MERRTAVGILGAAMAAVGAALLASVLTPLIAGASVRLTNPVVIVVVVISGGLLIFGLWLVVGNVLTATRDEQAAKDFTLEVRSEPQHVYLKITNNGPEARFQVHVDYLGGLPQGPTDGWNAKWEDSDGPTHTIPSKKSARARLVIVSSPQTDNRGQPSNSSFAFQRPSVFDVTITGPKPPVHALVRVTVSSSLVGPESHKTNDVRIDYGAGGEVHGQLVAL